MTLLTSNSRKQSHSSLTVVSDKPSVCGTLFFMGTVKKRKRQYHGLSHSKVWNAWRAMLNRCYRPNDLRYHLYGAKGKVVCDGLKGFNNFLNIVGLPPSKEYSLDRPDNDGSYTCGKCSQCKNNNWERNVRWATSYQQMQNQSTNHKIPYKGKMICIIEVARIVGIPYKTLFSRIKYRKWDIDIAINTPISKPHSYKKIKNDITKRSILKKL